MLKQFSFVILLTTLGLVSSDRAQGLSTEQENTDSTINIKLRQVCCNSVQQSCSIQVDAKMCTGTFRVELETSLNGASQPKLTNSNSSKLRPKKSGEREIPISVDPNGKVPISLDTNSNNSRLSKILEEIFAEKYGRLLRSTNESDESDGTKLSTDDNVLREPEVASNPIEEDAHQPQPILVKREDATFQPTYQKFGYKIVSGQLHYMPDFKEPKKHESVTPRGFSPTEISKIQLEVLYKANYYRSIYGMRELKLNENISDYSQNWANQLALRANHLAVNCTLERSKTSKGKIRYGENLFTSLPLRHVGEVAVDVFYYELASFVKDDETIDNNIFKNYKIQRLTQLLWMSSQQIGVGAAKGRDGKYYVVMNFNPMGNIRYFMKDNIPTFTQDQINDAQKKIDHIDTNSKILLELLKEGTREPTLPGWKTKLYEKYRTLY